MTRPTSTPRRSASAAHRRRARGASLLELLVASTLGLLLMSVCITLFVQVLREHRSALHEARLMQDLRSAIDIVARDLRRAGGWGAAERATFWSSNARPLDNPYGAQTPASAPAALASFNYSRDPTENNQLDSDEAFGVRLRNGAIELMLGQGNWQALTDSGTLKLTDLRITPTVHEVSLASLCTQACAASAPDCPPRQTVRSVLVELSGASSLDPSVTRSLRARVRVRNDTVSGRCPA
ncbi:MAG: hypothetical protein RJA98_1087 [Pseudomonadota bacterium]